jgi:hypothetical protein
MIRVAPAWAAPWTALAPIPPMPKITTVSPICMLPVFTAEPQPVGTAQPHSTATSSGRSSSTLTTDASWIVAYSENVPSMHIAPAFWPSTVNG